MAGIPDVNVEYVYEVAPTCTAGTSAGSYTKTTVAINTAMLWRLEIRIPPGHAGFTGIAMWDSGAWVIPFSSGGPTWIIGDDDLLEYPYNNQIGSNVVFATYNTGTFNHTWQIRMIYTPWASLVTETGSNTITSPDTSFYLGTTNG